jgi:tetratricopeptide (TPR) repeat protein
MARPAPFALLALLFALGAAGGSALCRPEPWGLGRAAAQPAPAGLPVPPEPTRLGDGADYDRCLSMLREDPEEALRFAGAWELTGGGEAALHCYALALVGTGEPARGAERLERLASGSRAGQAARATIYGQAAQAWMMLSDTDRAFAAVTIALTLSPQDTDLLTDRSIVLAAMRRYAAALEDLDRVIALEPERAEVWVLRAAALRHLDRAGPAMEAVERALALTPDNPEAFLERGILRQLRGDTPGAQADWRQTISLAPDSAAAELAEQNLQISEFGPTRR